MDGIEKELAVVENLSNSYSSNLQFVRALVEHSKPEELIDLQTIISQRLQQVNCNEMRQSLEDRLSISCTTSPSEEECEQTICQLIGDVSISLQSWHQHGESLVDEDESEWYVKGECDKRTSIFSPTAKSPELLRIPVLCVEFNSDLSTDSNNTWPTGVCTTVLGDIAICDRDNALIKIFTPTGIHKTSFSGELEYTLKKPFDITSLSTGELVVSDYGTESVKVFDSSGIGRLMICGEFEYPRGVAADRDDNILVLDTELGRVTIHSSTDGKLLQVVKGTSPLTNMIDPYYLCVSRHGDVIVTDFAEPNVKILSVNGAELPELNYGEYGVTTRQGLLQPYGCCQDVYGITFIADNRNDKISVLMPNGRFEQHLLTRRDGLWQPIALCIDMKGQLIVTEGLGKVKIYKYI
ncbi:hypothetical protein EB796_005776 [Bugula neritina]|uniref:TRIM71 n=1 Tax=Bugula neritina TaxID=10212 RepID=A0A7J7KCA1_BUGNE|nr:hypothetical protein EB796_005776 [Bugula neritina]